jgi:hypothetical protein
MRDDRECLFAEKKGISVFWILTGRVWSDDASFCNEAVFLYPGTEVQLWLRKENIAYSYSLRY